MYVCLSIGLSVSQIYVIEIIIAIVYVNKNIIAIVFLLRPFTN